MESNFKIKGYYTPKKLNIEAKIIGLNYNTFFILIVLGAILLIVGSKNGLFGFSISLVILFIIYLLLFILQTKLGKKEIYKVINDYNNPIRYIKIKTPFSRLYNKK